MNTKTLDQIKNEYYGEVGAPERDRLERELEALRIGFKIRSAREKLEMTQAELASRIDKKRTFISKVENDGENITLTTLFDIVGDLGWERTSSSLTDTDVYQLHWYLEKQYGLKNERNINKAMNIAGCVFPIVLVISVCMLKVMKVKQ